MIINKISKWQPCFFMLCSAFDEFILELDALIFRNITMTMNASGKSEWTCNLCGKAGPKRNIKNHVETHLEGVQQNCPYCDKTPKTREALRIHIIGYHKNKGV